jgi:hypothetical protein
MLLPFLATAALTACSSTAPESSEPARVEIEPWVGELPIGAPWLREQLPAATLAYQRIPHPLALLAIPKGNTLDTALGSEANIQNLVRIQEGLIGDLGVELPPARLLAHLRAPIEAVVVSAPGPSAMITTTLSLRSNADFEAIVAELSEHLPVALAGPLDDAGFANGKGRLKLIADLVGVDYDVWAMPTANQLGLPDRGTLGATVNLVAAVSGSPGPTGGDRCGSAWRCGWRRDRRAGFGFDGAVAPRTMPGNMRQCASTRMDENAGRT